MPEIVEADIRKIGFFDFALEQADQVPRKNGSAYIGSKYQPTLFPMGRLGKYFSFY
jgi:hypothetical protein